MAHVDRAGIPPGPVPLDAPETSVSGVASKAVTPQPVGRLDPQLLEKDIATKFATLDDCRIATARKTQVAPGEITADTLTLRWTIGAAGYVSAAEVVASAAINPEVMDCVKREANGWRFLAPAGGELRVERNFSFRAVSAVAR